MAKMWSLHGNPHGFEGLALKLINSVPKNKNEQLVKVAENTAGGENRPLFIKSTES